MPAEPTEEHHAWIKDMFGVHPDEFLQAPRPPAPVQLDDITGLIDSDSNPNDVAIMLDDLAQPRDTKTADPVGAPTTPTDPPLPNIPLPGGGSIPIQPVIDLAKSEFGELRILVDIYNNTDQTLFLGKSPDGPGEYKRSPPEKIGPHTRDYCIAVSSATFGFSVTGIDRRVEYDIGTKGDENTVWSLRFVNPRNLNPLQGAQNFADTDVFGTRDDLYQARKPPTVKGKADAEMIFVLEPAGTPPDPPNPNPNPPNPTPPGPGPAPATNASCLITITNSTQQTLSLSDTGTDQGNFVTQPASTLAPGASTQFAHLHTPGDTDNKPGCKGHVTYDIGAPSVAVWRMDWDNPIGSKNDATTSVDPQGLGFSARREIGNGDENVPFSFTLSGAAQPQPTPPGPLPPGPLPPNPTPPNPTPPNPTPPGPGPEPADWNPPAAGASEPTLRQGDDSPDGWVEYLQGLLVDNNFKIKVDGNFGPATYKAVVQFQTDKQLIKKDGIVGNETWSALREGNRQAPGTDGRQPHTFVDTGADARFTRERETMIYIASLDEAQILVTAVGEKPIKDFFCYLKITPPGGDAKSVRIKIGDPVSTPDDGQGGQHAVKIPGFRQVFPSNPVDAPISDYQAEAYLDAAIGNDKWSGPVRGV